jgi:hypothetical protein
MANTDKDKLKHIKYLIKHMIASGKLLSFELLSGNINQASEINAHLHQCLYDILAILDGKDYLEICGKKLDACLKKEDKPNKPD